MGAFLGLLCGVGLLLLVHRRPASASNHRRRPRRISQRIADTLRQAGLETVTTRHLVAAGGAAAGVVGTAVAAISHTATIAAAFAAFAGCAPWTLVRHRARRRRAELRAVWPDVVDNLASAVRAGLALPEAVAQLADRGPDELRPTFRRFADDYRVSGNFAASLDELKRRLADPTADRIIESLRMAREVGGTDLGRLLRTLSVFLREDLRIRAELETRQGWTVNGARLAVLAPWLLLGLLSLHPAAVHAYNSAAGVVILTVGASVSAVAYRAMVRIGRLPEEERVLR